MAVQAPANPASTHDAAAEAARRAAEEAARRAAEAARQAAAEAARQAAAEAARKAAAEAARKASTRDTFTSASSSRGPDLSGGTTSSAGSTLLTENSRDSSVNCLDAVGDFLELASPAIRGRSEVLFLEDTRSGAEGQTGHVVIRQGNNIYDPATRQWSEASAYFRSHPEYQQVGSVSGQTVHSILSAEPGPARQAALEKANLPANIAQMVVADSGGELPMPQWLEQGNRPPWFNAAQWNRLVPEDRAAILDGIRADWAEHVEGLEPAWMRDGTAPPPMTANWDMLPAEDQLAIAQSRWDAFVQEEMALYFGEVPSGGSQSQAPLLGSTNGWPWGSGMAGEWASLHQEGQKDIAQFLNTGFILDGEGASYTHGNLCGELSVISVLGSGLASGLQRFSELEGGEAILRDGDALTDSSDLEAFFRQNGWQIVGEDGDPANPAMQDLDGDHDSANTYYNNHAADPSPEAVERMLEDGGALVVLVNIDGANDGMLEAVGSSEQDITHWVSVLAVSENAQGETYVRVYNPYQNREEVYSWEEFKSAWNSPSESGFTYVAARQP